MQIDYKRDLNHTYVILQEEKEPDTASYQIRMLLTNAIPGLLDCKIGKMDDKTLFYYEVTSRSRNAWEYSVLSESRRNNPVKTIRKIRAVKQIWNQK